MPKGRLEGSGEMNNTLPNPEDTCKEQGEDEWLGMVVQVMVLAGQL